MLYTERYHDYTLPGGGIDEGEDDIEGLVRELEEETGAQNIRDIREFGLYEEHTAHGTNLILISCTCTLTATFVLLMRNSATPSWKTMK